MSKNLNVKQKGLKWTTDEENECTCEEKKEVGNANDDDDDDEWQE